MFVECLKHQGERQRPMYKEIAMAFENAGVSRIEV